ncbi:MAG: MMPL family transporter, partial [Acidimicrobiales bacterium]
MNPFSSLGRFVVRWRWVVLVAWLVAVPLATATLPKLSSVTKNDNTQFLPASAPSEKAATLATAFRPKEDGSATLVAVRSVGVLRPADLAAVDRAARRIAGLAFVHSVLDEGESVDQHAVEIFVDLKLPPYDQGSDATHAVDDMRAIAAHTGAAAGLALHLTGNLPLNVDEMRSETHSQGLTQQFALVFIVLLLLVVFRALLAPIVTLLPAAMALGLAEPVIAESTHIGVQVSFLLSLLLVVVVLGAGTDYGLFLIFRMREELRGGADPKDAVATSVQRVGESITFSALTVIAALVSLLLASFGLYRGLGPGLAIGIAMCLLANLTLLPALLAILGRSVFWPFVPKPGPHKRTFWGRVAGRVVHYPVRTLLLGVALFAGLALSMVAYTTSGFGNPALPAATDSSQGTAALKAHFASAASNPTVVVLTFASSLWTDPAKLEAAQKGLEHSGPFSSVTGALDPIGGSLQYPPAELAAAYRALGPPQELPLEPTAALSSALDRAGIPVELYEPYRAESEFVSASG